MEIRSDFSYEVIDDVLVIVDLCSPEKKTVTNDIDNVVRWIKNIKGWDNEKMMKTRIVYRDSTKIWDGVQWLGNSACFIALRVFSQEEAIEKIKEVRPWRVS